LTFIKLIILIETKSESKIEVESESETEIERALHFGRLWMGVILVVPDVQVLHT